MTRHIRLYDSPAEEKPGNVLGFSCGLAHVAEHPAVANWLIEKGYTVTPESAEQKRSKIKALGGLTLVTAACRQADGIPLPGNTASIAHVLIEPPLQDGDVADLGAFFSSLAALRIGENPTFFLDNRQIEPNSIELTNVVATW
jgi:hypothetical protein